MKPQIVISVSGGVAEYYLRGEADIILVDWDNLEDAPEADYDEVAEELGRIVDPELRALFLEEVEDLRRTREPA